MRTATNDRISAWIRLVLMSAAFFATAPQATAIAQERWAAIARVGDRMNLIYARSATGTTGSNTNPNRIVAVPTQDDVLDRLVLRALVNSSLPGSPDIVPLALRDPRFYQAQEKLFEAEG